ncbi:pseudouridine synthase [Accumulibacter sp.]|uniref:pseudouridine synthase n=1 Tax=Accumulibacter sp. TaxID=2053492 RepID=UPI0028C39DD8|nr:S4 domain-containing protein [Accumulibacter sp.]
MPRQTLKLPRKPAASATADDSRAHARKPIRGGSQASKRAAKWRTDSSPAVPAPVPALSRTGDRPNAAPRFKRDAAEATRKHQKQPDGQPPTARRGSSDDTQQPSQPLAAEDHQAPRTVASTPARDSSGGLGGARNANRRPDKPSKKVYPPRGVARSTGARAFPPAPPNPDTDPDAAPTSARSPLPQTQARQDPQPTRQPDPANVPTSTPRGLAKESPRLSKLVSQLAACSRREADEWIENGWVSVDGVVINRLGARVNPKASIKIKEAARQHSTETVSIVFHKPRDLAGEAEDGRERVALLIRSDNRWAEDSTAYSFQASHLRGLTPAGRLEADEGGMLAFTQEGSVARRVTGGDSRLEKEYHVRVLGELAPEGLELLRHGLSLDDVKLKRAQVSWLSDQQLRFVMHESRKGQIQRMCELVGLQVTDIKRVRIGSVSLGKLPAGQWRYVRKDERF